MIRFQQVSLARGVKPLLDKTDLLLNPGDKIGLIGANGAGKSTCSRCCAACCTPTRATWTTGHLAHGARGPGNTGAGPPGHRVRHRRRRHAAPAGGRAGRAGSRAGKRRERPAHGRDLRRAGRRRRLHRALARRAAADRPGLHAGTDAAAADQLLGRLARAPEPGAGADVPVRPAAAGRAHQPPGPGRHHLAGGRLKRYPGTLLIISHDRDFLDEVVNVVVHIDERKLRRYSGNYSSFERQRAAQLVLARA